MKLGSNPHPNPLPFPKGRGRKYCAAFLNYKAVNIFRWPDYFLPLLAGQRGEGRGEEPLAAWFRPRVFKFILRVSRAALKRHKCRAPVVVALFVIYFTAHAGGPSCAFDKTKMEFSGTPLEQAKCLLRPVARGGVLGKPLATLPQPLEKLIGQPVQINKSALQQYLSKHHIAESDIGGPLTNKVTAKYFVIHDTSTPNYHEKPFPADINEASWRLNDFARWKNQPVAHMFVNRVGQSLTWHEFSVSWRATKFESSTISKEQSRGMFVHTELSQPRRADPKSFAGNDAIAPMPGITTPQLDRLALLYVAASFEHGQWLVPGYHCAIDAGIPDGHDDPQNFDLNLWANRLELLLKEINRER